MDQLLKSHEVSIVQHSIMVDAWVVDSEQMEAVAAQVKPISVGSRIVVYDSESPCAGKEGVVVAAGAGKRWSVTAQIDGATETRLMWLSAVVTCASRLTTPAHRHAYIEYSRT